MTTIDYDALEKRMLEWAQNEEMVDQHFTQHGRDCYEVGSAIRDLRAANSALEDTIHYAWNERDRLAGLLAVCGVIAHEGDGACLPEYETDSVLAVRKLRAERDALRAALTDWVNDCYCQQDTLEHPLGCGRCEDSRAALAAQERKL